MGLKLSVKIGDVTNLSDARYAAGMGVDYIGFNIDPSSENFVTAKTFEEITKWISGVGIIGEIGNSLKFSKDDYPSFLFESSNPGNLKIENEFVYRIDAKNIAFDMLEKSLKTEKNALFYVLEVTNKQLEENVAGFTNLCNSFPIYVSTDFNEPLLEKVVNTIKPTGIEIKGGLEAQPGFKDYDGIADVLEWLEEDD